MSGKTMAIVGAGPGLGLAIARRFGLEGFNVALIARNRNNLDRSVTALSRDNIAAAGFVGDVTQDASIAQAFRDVERRFGNVDVLEYSPVNIPADPSGFAALDVTAMATATVQEAFAVMAKGAVTSVAQVLPGMIARQSGTIFITTGISARVWMPFIGAWGMAGAAARNYGRTLHAAVADKGIYVATVCIGVPIKTDDALGDPGLLAEKYFALYRDRDQAELFISPPLPPGADDGATI
jgi:NAD(P)-dependent dehydrogenase (short-subunit alcohol dehydrogenase family)